MRADRLLRDRLRTTMVVTLTDETAFKGLLIDVDRRSVVLREAVLVSGSQPQPVDGEMIIPWDRVLYLQRP